MRSFHFLLQWIVPIWIALLTVLTSLALLVHRQTEDGLRSARANLARCYTLANDIEALRSADSVALDQPVSASVVSSELLRVSRHVGISEAQVQEIQHLPTTQVEKTDFRRDDTLLRFNAVSVKQLANLLLELENQEQAPTPTSLVLRTAGSEANAADADESWTVELILTRLAFAAQSPTESPIR